MLRVLPPDCPATRHSSPTAHSAAAAEGNSAPDRVGTDSVSVKTVDVAAVE